MAVPSKTLTELFERHIDHHGDRAACWVKGRSGWEEVSWAEWHERSTLLASWLKHHGVAPGRHIVLASANRFHWMVVLAAAHRLGATCITTPPHLSPQDLRDLVFDSAAHIVFVEGPLHIDALSMEGAPRTSIDQIVYFSARSELPDGSELLLDQVTGWPVDERIISFDELQEVILPPLAHEKHEEDGLSDLDEEDAHQAGTVMFSAGTHGDVSSFMVSAAKDLEQGRALADAMQLSASDVVLIALPLWHVSGRVLSLACMEAGAVAIFVEEGDKLIDEMQAVHPTIVATRAHLFERLYSRITADAGTANPLRKALFTWAMSRGESASHLREKNEPPGLWLSAQIAIANQLVFKSLHELFGRRLRFFFAAGGVVLESAARFFDSAGVLILESYTTTRTGYSHTNRPDHYRFGSAGLPLDGVEASVDGDEVVIGSPWLASKWTPEEGADAPPEQAATGDVGAVDEDDWLLIEGRTNEIIVLSTEQRVLVGRLERALRSAPLIEHAVVIGEGHPFLSALVTLDQDSVRRWGEEHGIEGSFSELSQNRRIFGLVETLVNEVNASRPSHEQIRKFAVLERRLSQKEEELTPMLEIRREMIVQHFEGVISSFYESQF